MFDILENINDLLCYPYIIAVSCFSYLCLRYIFKKPSNRTIFIVLVISGITMYLCRFMIDQDMSDHNDEESLFLSFFIAAVAHEGITRYILSRFDSTSINKKTV